MSCECGGQHRTLAGCRGAAAWREFNARRRRSAALTDRPAGVPAKKVRSGPPCACGCGRQCWNNARVYATPQCVPIAQRQAGARRARRAYAFAHRRAKFHQDLERVLRDGRINREELLATFQAIYDRGRTAERQEACRARKEQGA